METTDFYKEEVRQGYTITSTQKKVWAVQLDMLDEVDRICKKYNIPYFADSGTLIGAVREKGYIPWDDDIDLIMMRPDYQKFIRVAERELKEPLVLQTAYCEENYLRGHAQIRNSETTGANKEDIKAGYNCGIFIDIFPMDAMPDSPLAAKWWGFQVKLSWILLYNCYRYGYYENATIAGKLIHMIGTMRHCPLRTAYARYERLCRKYEKRNTQHVCDTNFIRALKKNTWRREWFAGSHYVPFENRMIPIPDGYDGRLRQEYGEYMTPSKAPTEHGDLVLDPDVSYREKLNIRKEVR